MKNIKKIICSLIALTIVISQVNLMSVAKDVYANGTEVNVNLKVGEDYIINSGNITDDVDGTTINMEPSFDKYALLYNHTSNTANSLNSFSTTPNSNITLSDATFKFTCVDETNSLYTIYNKKTNQFYTQQSSANSYFTTGSFDMKVIKTQDGFFKISKSDGKRYMVFYLNNMDFNGYGDSRNTNNSTDLYDLTLLEKQNTVSADDIIPGYKKATSIISGNSYLITVIYNGNVFLLYPHKETSNQTANQTKLVKSKYYDLYAIGSTTASDETVAQNHITITNTDNGYTFQASNGKYMNNIGSGAILTTDTKYFAIEEETPGQYRIKTMNESTDNNNNRYYVFHYDNAGFKLNAMKGYSASWDGVSGDYSWMIFEKSENLDFNSLIPGYTQVIDLNTISSDKQYILVYEKVTGTGNGTYIVYISGNNQNTNSLRKVEKISKQLQVNALQGGKDTVVVDGITYNFNVVTNIADKTVNPNIAANTTLRYTDGSKMTGTTGNRVISTIFNGDRNKDNYFDFGDDKKSGYLEIDLGAYYDLSSINALFWYGNGNERRYSDVVVLVSENRNFTQDDVVYNDDDSGKHGFGPATATDTGNETSAGRTIEFETRKARFVRVYMAGSTAGKANQVVEIEVYGVPSTTVDFVKYTDTADLTSKEWLFESYYEDNTGATAVKPEVETKVAKYITPDVLTVKAQTEIEEGNANVRFISSVASGNLENVKFKIEIMDENNTVTKTGSIKTTKAYGKIYADGVQITNASDVFDNSASTYFVACKLNNIPSSASSSKIRVTPYWLPNGYADAEENYVEGVSRTFTVQEFFDNASQIINEGE